LEIRAGWLVFEEVGVTERKPPGVGFESWVEKQIREAAERGDFDNLPGQGKPLQDEGAAYDENWWIKRKLRDEQLALLTPSLSVQRDVEDFLDNLDRIPSEAALRRRVGELNTRIVAVRRGVRSGQPLGPAPLDIDSVVGSWKAARSAG
jgi:hypothetical protein